MSDRKLPDEIYAVFAKEGLTLAFEDRQDAMHNAGENAAQWKHEGPWMVEKYVRQAAQATQVADPVFANILMSAAASSGDSGTIELAAQQPTEPK